MSLGESGGELDYKACCAAVYDNEGVRFLFGEAWRPGGTALTEELVGKAGLGEPDLVLDLACGAGESARLIGSRFGSLVVGVDLGLGNLKTGARRVDEWPGPGCPPAFVAGDADSLPFADASFEMALCECSLSTFVHKPAALIEVARVLRGGGRLCLTDVTLAPGSLPEELDSLVSRVACLGGALPIEGYVSLLEEAGFVIETSLDYRDEALGFLRSVDRKLLLVRLAQSVKKIDLAGIDVVAARRMLKSGMDLVEAGKLSYAAIIAHKADGSYEQADKS